MLQSVKMRNVLFSSIVIAASVLLPVGAGSQQTPDLGPCKEDFAKFCHGVRPGGGRILRCMKLHLGELNPDCRVYLGQEAGKAVAAKAKEACQADMDKFCPGVQPGEGRLLQCLDAHKQQLSRSCNEIRKRFDAAAKKGKSKLKQLDAFSQACGNDARTLCPDVQPGGGAVVACLKQHLDQVSDTCKSFAANRRASVRP